MDDLPSSDPLLLLHDVARILRTRSDQRARTHGMTRAQWIILFRLHQRPGLSQNELAQLTDVEPITIARLIDRLEARGLVERRSDPRDRRLRRLHLTDAAQPHLGALRGFGEEMRAILTAGLDPATVANVTEALVTMKKNLTLEKRDSRAG